MFSTLDLKVTERSLEHISANDGSTYTIGAIRSLTQCLSNYATNSGYLNQLDERLNNEFII